MLYVLRVFGCICVVYYSEVLFEYEKKKKSGGSEKKSELLEFRITDSAFNLATLESRSTIGCAARALHDGRLEHPEDQNEEDLKKMSKV